MNTMFVIRLDKATKLKDGKYPIILQITYDRNVRKKRLGLSASFDQWDFTNHEYKKGVHNRAEYNRQLEEYIKRAKTINDTYFEDIPFNYNHFIQYFDKPKAEKMSLINFCVQVSNTFATTGQLRSQQDYNVLANAIRRVSPNDLQFENITKEWLLKFESYHHERGSNCYSYMKLLKILYMKAVQKGIVDVKFYPFRHPFFNPFGYQPSTLKKIKIKRVNSNRIKALLPDDLRKIMNYKPQSEHEQQCLDFFFLSYYMFGVNFIDIAQMKYKDIRDGKWFYSRSKTGVTLTNGKPLNQKILEIIERNKTKGEYIFDIFNEKDNEAIKLRKIDNMTKKITKTTKRISKKLGLDGYFTYYSARHTSATIALNLGADKNTVSKLLDHSNLSTLDHYAGDADYGNILKAMELLELKLH